MQRGLDRGPIETTAVRVFVRPRLMQGSYFGVKKSVVRRQRGIDPRALLNRFEDEMDLIAQLPLNVIFHRCIHKHRTVGGTLPPRNADCSGDDKGPNSFD
ncbi:hypothetical protein D3C87_1273290 [compost metagenome]